MTCRGRLAVVLAAVMAGLVTRATVRAEEAALTEPEALERAVVSSPEIQTAQARVRVAEGELAQARVWTNPALDLELENFHSSVADGVAEKTVSVSQELPWPGKRAARVAAADAGLTMARLDLERVRLDLGAEVARRFVALLGAQERLAIAEENLETAAEVCNAVAALVEGGEVSPIEEVRSSGERALTRLDRDAARRDLEQARRSLAQLWGDPATGPVRVTGDLGAERAVAAREQGMARLGALPELARFDAELTRLEAEEAGARKQALPDFALSAGYRGFGDTGQHAYVAGLSFSLPLFDRNAGGRAAASARTDEIRQQKRGEEIRVRAAYLQAHESLTFAVEEVRTLREDVLPRARQVFEALQEGYRRGKFPLLDLLEARRSLAAARLRFVDAQVRAGGARADLDRFVVPPEANMTGVSK